MSASVCSKIRKMLSSQFRKAFNQDFESNLKFRNQELWLLGIDAKRKTLVDICGIIDPRNLDLINSKGFRNTDAGYRVNAQDAIGFDNVSVDIFLINTDHYNAKPDIIEPIVVHELSHMLEQVNFMANPQYNDQSNAEAILKSLLPDVLDPKLRHNEQWALHLAAGARTILSKGHTGHKTIRSYLEAAIPHYDRQSAIKAAKAWP